MAKKSQQFVVTKADLGAFPENIRKQLEPHFAETPEKKATDTSRAYLRGTKVFDEKLNEMFDSKTEYARAKELLVLQRAGEITDLVFHPTFVLVPCATASHEIKVTLDFGYKEDNVPILEDVKAFRVSDRFRLIVKLWRFFGRGVLRTHKKVKGRVTTSDVIRLYDAIPERKGERVLQRERMVVK